MNFYSIPSDFKKETIDKYTELNRKYNDSKIRETYGSVTSGSFYGSGRLTSQMPKIDYIDLHDYILYSKKNNIDFNYTINSPSLQNHEFTKEGLTELAVFIKDLYDVGVRSLTITLPSILELVLSSGLDFKIKASTICQITNPAKALFYKNLGVNKIVVDESINRKFKTLQNIVDVFGDEVEVIANQICDLNCIYRMFHYNMISGEFVGKVNKMSVDFYEHRCVLQQLKTSDNLLKLSWIRPEDIKYYNQIGIKHFKLQGRHTFLKGGDPVRTVECYMKEDYDGDLYNLLTMFANLTNFRVHIENKRLEGFISPFFKKEEFCNYMCDRCNYCKKYASECLDVKGAEDVSESARNFYNQFDEYKLNIKNLFKNNSDNINNVDFNFYGE